MDDSERLERLLTVFRGAERAVLMTHDNPDPDSLAAALALQTLLNECLGMQSAIVYGGILGRAENRTMVSVLGIPAVPLEDFELEPSDRVALLDTQPRTGNNSLPPEIVPTAVFDHHPLVKETRQAAFFDVRESFGATATMLYRYLGAAEARLSRTLATALYIAIKVETRDLSRETSTSDREAYLELLPKVDRRAISDIEIAPVSRDYFRTLGQAIAGTQLFGPVAIAAIGPIQAPEIVAEYADMLARLERIQWVLSMGSCNATLYMSLRTNLPSVNAGELIRVLVNGWGKAGGHGTMAGGRIPLKKSYDETICAVSARFLKLMGAENVAGETLSLPLGIKGGAGAL